MTHLTAEELTRWRDSDGSTDRQRVVDHLAACESCRRLYVDLVRATSPRAEASYERPEEFVARGVAAYRPATARGQWWPAWRPALAGLAAVILVVTLLPLMRGRDRVAAPAGGAIRGTEIQPMSPVGIARDPLEFRWVSPFSDVSRYRLAVRRNGQTVLTADASTTRLVLNDTERARLAPGVEYEWTVDALDARGDVIASSPPRTFVVGR